MRRMFLSAVTPAIMNHTALIASPLPLREEPRNVRVSHNGYHQVI
jgi:hypothetical protein